MISHFALCVAESWRNDESTEAKEKFYPEYKYALVRAGSHKPHSLYVDRETDEEERRDLWKCYGAVLIVIDLSEVEE